MFLEHGFLRRETEPGNYRQVPHAKCAKAAKDLIALAAAIGVASFATFA